MLPAAGASRGRCFPAESHDRLSADQLSPAPDAQNETGEGATAGKSGCEQAGEDDLEEFSLDDIEIIESKVFA